ncbi:MAG: extracellular solute-binding protein [Anaerolineae bacterium]|nr:extracellular solute-binding protein [Anaerolineae bacterium]
MVPRRFYPVMAMLALLGLLLAACAPAATPTPTAAPPTPAPGPTPTAPKKVTITIWHQWDGKYLDAITQVFKDYEAAHPGVTIDLSRPENVMDALRVAIPAGQGPDIIGWANDQIGNLALAGLIVPLNEHGITEDFLKNTYVEVAAKAVIYQGKIWALPETMEGIGLVYNKALVTPEFLPTDPMNFDDLLAKARAFAEKNPGKFLVCNQGLGGNDPYHVAPIYFGFGVPSYVDEEGKVYLNTPEALKAAQWMLQFREVAPKETSHDICKSLLTEGKVGAWWTGPWAIADIEAAKIDYGIAPMGRPFVGIKTLMLSKNAVDRGNVAAALDIMKYFTSAEVQKKLALVNKTIPAQIQALNDPEVQALPTVKGFGESLKLGVPMASTPYAAAQWGPVGEATVAIWTGAQKPVDALAAAQKAIEDAIAQMK